MRSANSMSRALRGSFAALAACASIAPAFAGGPLYVVPVGSTVQPARWAGTVQVYTDRGSLGAIDNAAANQLVANTSQQWSSVPTSSFRAVIAGALPEDITGANPAPAPVDRRPQRRRHPGDLRQRRQRARRLHGRGLRRARHRHARVPRGRGLHADRRGLDDHPRRGRFRAVPGVVPGHELRARPAHFGHRHARVRPRDQPRAHSDQRLLRAQPPEPRDAACRPARSRPVPTSAATWSTPIRRRRRSRPCIRSSIRIRSPRATTARRWPR